MALHPIGSNKNLIEIRTEFVDVIVKERKKSPVPSYRLNGEIETEIKVVGPELKSLVVRGEPVRVSQEATQDGIMTSCKTSPGPPGPFAAPRWRASTGFALPARRRRCPAAQSL